MHVVLWMMIQVTIPSHLTSTSLPPHFHLTFTSLSPHFHLTFTSLSPHFHLTFTSLSPHFHLTFTSLPPHFHLIFTTPTTGKNIQKKLKNYDSDDTESDSNENAEEVHGNDDGDGGDDGNGDNGDDASGDESKDGDKNHDQEHDHKHDHEDHGQEKGYDARVVMENDDYGSKITLVHPVYQDVPELLEHLGVREIDAKGLIDEEITLEHLLQFNELRLRSYVNEKAAAKLWPFIQHHSEVTVV
jgi:hypothetical protein